MKITDIIIKPLEVKSSFINPQTMIYTQNGKEHRHHFNIIYNSAAVTLFNVTRNVLIFVRQFRPAVYIRNIPVTDWGKPIDLKKYPPELGVTTEMCAGICDKNVSIEQIAAEEVLEECGYEIDARSLEKVKSYLKATFFAGSLQHLYYCEVDDGMRVSPHGGIHRELEHVETMEMTIPEAKRFAFHGECREHSAALLFAISWFLTHKYNKFVQNYTVILLY